MQIFRFLTAPMKFNQIPYVIFQATSQFSFKFCMTFNVMTHKSYETFLLKHYMLWTKTTYQSTIFQTFMCSNERSPNSLCHFWNHKVSIYSDFPSLFGVMKDNSLYFCSLNLVYFGQKESIEKKISDFWMAGRKFTKVLISYLKTQVSFSLHHSSVSWEIPLL